MGLFLFIFGYFAFLADVRYNFRGILRKFSWKFIENLLKISWRFSHICGFERNLVNAEPIEQLLIVLVQ